MIVLLAFSDSAYWSVENKASAHSEIQGLGGLLMIGAGLGRKKAPVAWEAGAKELLNSESLAEFPANLS